MELLTDNHKINKLMGTRKKVIWLVCLNAQPPYCDTHLRHQKFAELLENKGYDVYIVIGSYLHYNGKQIFEHKKRPYIIKEYDGKKYVVVDVPSYKNNGIKRIWAIFKFGLVVFVFRNRLPKPDVIVHNMRVPFDSIIYLAAKRLNARYITEVWDLWPESFVETKVKTGKNNAFLKIAYQVEKYLYSRADRAIFTMEGAIDYIKYKKWDIEAGGSIDLSKISYINNGVDLVDFNLNVINNRLYDDDLNNSEVFKVIYLGSIGLVNNIMALIKAAEVIKDETNVIFLIYGDGDYRQELIDYCKSKEIHNVKFKEKWVDIKYVPYILTKSNLNILNYKPMLVLKYGISQGKFFQYLASGKPIVANNVMGYDMVRKYNIGISNDFSSPEEYAETILYFVNLSEEKYQEYCSRVIKTSELYDYKHLFKSYLNVIESVLND
jgi:glycosyltransferase involved in cell wall biosynthesis